MKTPTIKSFIEDYAGHIPASLVRATIRQFGGFERFQDQAQDVTNHGINGGFSGFIYYGETTEFAKKHKDDILTLAENQARDCGESDAFQFIAGFNCLRDDGLSPTRIARLLFEKPQTVDNEGDQQQLLNALAWYAGEEVARAWGDYLDYLKNDA